MGNTRIAVAACVAREAEFKGLFVDAEQYAGSHGLWGCWNLGSHFEAANCPLKSLPDTMSDSYAIHKTNTVTTTCPRLTKK